MVSQIMRFVARVDGHQNNLEMSSQTVKEQLSTYVEWSGQRETQTDIHTYRYIIILTFMMFQFSTKK